MNDAVARVVAAWRRSMSWLAAAWRGELGKGGVPYAAWADGWQARARAHARLAVDCMRADILIEYTPGHRVVVDGKIGDMASESILTIVDGQEHSFRCRPVTLDWKDKDAIAWRYDL